MAVKIRLKRLGSRHRPFYRIIVADARMPRDGRFIETIGTYNPVEKTVIIKIKENKVIDWIMKGAQMTTTVESLLRKTKTLEKIHLLREGKKPLIEDELSYEFKETKKKKKLKEQPEAEMAKEDKPDTKKDTVEQQVEEQVPAQDKEKALAKEKPEPEKEMEAEKAKEPEKEEPEQNTENK